MKSKLINKYLLLVLMFVMGTVSLKSFAAEGKDNSKINVQELVMEHTNDAHEWHITTINGHPISIPLPVIVKSSTGWQVFMSSRFDESANGIYNGLYLNKDGKICEKDASGAEQRVTDLSITKDVLQLWIVVALLLVIFLYCAHWYKHKKPEDEAPKGFVGFMEMFVLFVYNDVIKETIDEKHYKFFAPYLLTVFFFIFLCNILGLIPIFPGGANLTGNIAITFFLAICTMLLVNVFGSKAYWKDIFWPDVPWWLKCPVPLLPVIEFFGVFTKPFALMIRLFANIFGGHAVAISLTCVIFTTFQLSIVKGATISPISVVLMIFMDLLEVLVAFLQAFVFTILSSVFIGLAHQEEEKPQTEITK
jgi:F-type H+-transporting ATPase subunit a